MSDIYEQSRCATEGCESTRLLFEKYCSAHIHPEKPAPQASHTSKELREKISNLKIILDYADAIYSEFSDYIDEEPYIDEILALIQQRESILLKKISDLYGLPLPELEKNLAHYKSHIVSGHEMEINPLKGEPTHE